MCYRLITGSTPMSPSRAPIGLVGREVVALIYGPQGTGKIEQMGRGARKRAKRKGWNVAVTVYSNVGLVAVLHWGNHLLLSSRLACVSQGLNRTYCVDIITFGGG